MQVSPQALTPNLPNNQKQTTTATTTVIVENNYNLKKEQNIGQPSHLHQKQNSLLQEVSPPKLSIPAESVDTGRHAQSSARSSCNIAISSDSPASSSRKNQNSQLRVTPGFATSIPNISGSSSRKGSISQLSSPSPSSPSSPLSSYRQQQLLNKKSQQQQQAQPTAVSLQQIRQTNTDIKNLIDQLDSRLQLNYQVKEQQVIAKYKHDIIQAHKRLQKLRADTNQEQIKNEMNEKSLQLKKERLQLIQTNMYYSNKCLQFKKVLDQCTTEGNQLEKQLEFLEQQLNTANKKRVGLMAEVYDRGSVIGAGSGSGSGIRSDMLLPESLSQQVQTSFPSSLSKLSKSIKKQRNTLNDNQNIESLPISSQRKTKVPNQTNDKTHSAAKKSSISTTFAPNTEALRRVSAEGSTPLSCSNSMEKNQSNLPSINNKKKQLEYTEQVKKLFNEKLISNDDSMNHDNKNATLGGKGIGTFTDRYLSGNENTNTDDKSKLSQTAMSKLSRLQHNDHNSRAHQEEQEKMEVSKALEQLFMQAVGQIKDKRKLSPRGINNAEAKKGTPLFRGQEYTDVQKRSIMKLFFEKQEVKRHIYDIIFEKTDTNAIFGTKKKNAGGKSGRLSSRNNEKETVKIEYNNKEQVFVEK